MGTVEIESFAVGGPCIRTNSALEASGAGKLAGLWASYYPSRPPSSEPVYGVYSDYQSNEMGEYTVTAGTTTGTTEGSVVVVTPGTYLAFRADGPMPGAIIGAWKAVWDFFSNNPPYERVFSTDFERYDGPSTATIYIGVKACG